nr:unnamed protein product [Spirometra erinaceieuropaei]
MQQKSLTETESRRTLPTCMGVGDWMLASSRSTSTDGNISVEVGERRPFTPDARCIAVEVESSSVDAEDSDSFQEFRVGDAVLPSQLQYSAKTAEMEVVGITDMACVDSPGHHYVQECRHDNDLTHPQFGVQLKAVTIPHRLLLPVEGLTGFGEPVGNLIVDSGAIGKCAAEISKIIHGV